MKDLYGYHIVLTTHNSRTSNRMVHLGIKKGKPLLLNTNQEIILSKIIGDIIRENHFKCVAYNICKDHLHLLIVCQPAELTKIVQRLKSNSSRRFQRSGALAEELIKYHNRHLWSQKFFRASLDDWQFAHLSTKPGEVYRSDHLLNSIEYIQNNRIKHQLNETEELKIIISDFVVSIQEAYELK